ncbi:MAG: substrate-binding domain-containing protein [Candidatus Eisenbacteria bacterium]
MKALPRVFLVWLLIPLVLCLGCQKQETESPTSGILRFVCAESVAPVIQKEAAEFQRLYTKASIAFDTTTTREALIKLFNKETAMVIISREVNAEEAASLAAEKYSPGTFALAKVGIAVIVNPDNPVRELNLDQVGGIYSGRISRWDQVGGGGGKITPLAMPRNSGTTEVFLRTIGVDTTLSGALRVLPGSREIADLVAKDPLSVGFVGMNWLSDRVRALALAEDASNQFITIHQASVHQGDYPLVQTIYAITTAGAYTPASGFISFLASAPGQKIFLDSGLVPVTMPVKLIRID